MIRLKICTVQDEWVLTVRQKMDLQPRKQTSILQICHRQHLEIQYGGKVVHFGENWTIWLEKIYLKIMPVLKMTNIDYGNMFTQSLLLVEKIKTRL